MDFESVLKKDLSKAFHVVKIEDEANGLVLKKEGKQRRFLFSIDEINAHFGGIKNLLFYLKKQGYQQTKFTIKKIYGKGTKITQHKMNTHFLNLEATNNPTEQMPITSVLGNPSSTDNSRFLSAFIQAERSEDYKRRITDLEEDLRDYRAKNRTLTEENHSLKLKVELSEAKADLKVKQELLSKKSVFESDGFQKLAEGLGGLIPHLAPVLMNNGTQNQLGSPSTQFSPFQSKVMEMIKNANDETLALVTVVLQDASIQRMINNYLENAGN